jgi:predicted nucleotidyltransferase
VAGGETARVDGLLQDEVNAGPVVNSPEALQFYSDALKIIAQSGVPFLVAGTFAVSSYTGIQRKTKDIDIFCKPGDYPRILHAFAELGYRTEVQDERWIAKVWKGDDFFDVIFNSTAAVTPVTDEWFKDAREVDLLGTTVRVLAPTELIWSKAFVQNRERYDGADIAHMFLKEHESVDWKKLLDYMEQYWEVLLIHILNFRFIYPADRHRVPDWIMDELLDRLRLQRELPVSQMQLCRGRMFSRTDYLIDVQEWGFADVVGQEGSRV